ncbi:MAG: carboxy terminal-processing peptidase [Xanthomonadales bacterium]|nr:carboxy terminal-processing peptidase [Xanthomonadales bacterium]
MKKIISTAILTLALPGLVLALADKPVDNQPLSLKPEPEHRIISSKARLFLDRYHYKPSELNDSLSQEIFEQYIQSLDPSRSYFLASDIAHLERYRDKLDDYLNRDQVGPAFEIFNLYRQRVAERIAYATDLLEGEFDFTVDETLLLDREDQPWAVNQKDLEDYWRRRVKNDWLRLKLTDKEPDAIKETLSKRYNMLGQRIEEVKPMEVFTWFINAYTQAVEPHTNYFSPRDSEAFDISMSLSLEGIGALLERDGEYTAIRSIVSGGPAYLDGQLQPGDRIVGVAQNEEDVVDVVGWRLDDVVDLIRGPKDTIVRLEVLPAELGVQATSKMISLTRNEIKLEAQAAKKEIVTVPSGAENGDDYKLGVIRLPSFYVDMAGRASNRPGYRSTTSDVRRLIQELRQEGIDGLMIDLRDNGGGALTEAISMTGLFIDTGPVVQVRDSRGQIDIKKDRVPGTVWDGPLAVMVNRYSASASEIFAGAIQDYKRGLIIGEATFGKGTVQNLIDLNRVFSTSEDDRLGQLKLTVAQFFRVNGESTQLRGVLPDIALPSTNDIDDQGESAYENALPWTKIPAAGYAPSADFTAMIDQLGTKHQARRGVDPELQYLLGEIEQYNKVRDRTQVSLLESARRAEMDEQEARKKRKSDVTGLPRITFEDEGEDAPGRLISAEETDAEDENAHDNNDDLDVYLDESARILADFITLSTEQPYLVQATDAQKGPALSEKAQMK